MPAASWRVLRIRRGLLLRRLYEPRVPVRRVGSQAQPFRALQMSACAAATGVS
jgi:hypothetical protein